MICLFFLSQQGETSVLVTVVSKALQKPSSFLPLTVSFLKESKTDEMEQLTRYQGIYCSLVTRVQHLGNEVKFTSYQDMTCNLLKYVFLNRTQVLGYKLLNTVISLAS